MGTSESWENSPSAPGMLPKRLEAGAGNSDGFLESSRNFLLGGKSAAWLRENQEKTFPLVERSRQQLVALQEALGDMLSDFQLGILPQVTSHTPDGPVETDMSTLQFLERATDIAGTQVATLDKIAGVMNKVATGGTNILTAALMGSNALQFAAQRKERVMRPARKVGVDAIPEGVIDIDV